MIKGPSGLFYVLCGCGISWTAHFFFGPSKISKVYKCKELQAKLISERCELISGHYKLISQCCELISECLKLISKK